MNFLQQTIFLNKITAKINKHYQQIHRNPKERFDYFLSKNQQKRVQQIILGIKLLRDSKLDTILSQICIALRFKLIIVIKRKVKKYLYAISSF